ncbi:MAG: LysR family transcriptional regulator [Nitrospiraceae bacterium]|nr:LysR family transcriptional regulator [Nitrospiraceae bacterium]
MENPRPQLDQLLTFHKVATLGSISAAADEMGLSQPAISVQMRNLATAIGEPILQRHKGGVALTPAGRALVPYAANLAKSYASTCDFVDSLRSLLTGSISIASSNTIAAHLLPGFVARFIAVHPDITLSVSATNSQGVIDGIRSLTADVGFVEGPVREFGEDLETYVIGGDSLVLVYSESFAQASNSLSPAELVAQLPFIFREHGSGTRRVSEEALGSLGVTPHKVLELAGTEAVKEAVVDGYGVALLSSLVVKREVEMGYLHQLDLGLEELRRNFCMVLPANEQRSRALEAFVGTVLQGAEYGGEPL